MKKFFFLVIALCPMLAFANYSTLGVKYVNWDLSGCYGGCPTIDGPGVQYSGAINNNILLDFQYADVGTDYASVDYTIAQAAYAFGDLDSGAFHIGAASFDAGYDRENVASIGYSRRGGDEFDYTISVLDTDIDTTLSIAFRTTIGITLDLMHSGGDNLIGIGYSWQLGQN